VTSRPSNDPTRSAHKAWLRALEATAPIAHNPSLTFPVLIDRLAEKFGSAPALISERECLTYEKLAQRSNQYARWALKQKITAGHVLGLLMPNCPEYMAIWLGVTRVGGTVAFINTNLSSDLLARAIETAGSRHVVVKAELAGNIAAVRPKLAPDVAIWRYGPGDDPFRPLHDEIVRLSGVRISDAECSPPALGDPALYVYTSGTTGFPKAAVISHLRLMHWTHWFAGLLDFRPSDRVYNCLPMYHGLGGIVATGAPLVKGASAFIRQGFSASSFWDDVSARNCTVFQYTGELCRYLVASPPHPREAEHQIRLCFGNGLRAEVWDAFKRRFAIPHIIEFYAATESNVSLYNCEEKPGAIGRIPPFLSHRFPIALIRHDTETGDPVRDEQGFCVPCSVNEVGEGIGRIGDGGAKSGARFEGYSDADATQQKILRNVFKNGDAWFRTGDLLRKDEAGYFYFVDRIGDTYRWKGENVSTSEVADAISGCPGVLDAVAYGIAIPGTEGRAGMATIVIDRNFDLAILRRHLVDRLPAYARPLLLRISRQIEATATFKPKKRELAREGYDPDRISDPIYFDDAKQEAFVKFDASLYERLLGGHLRV
jgi:fatty-acyl-CoA synthase